MMLVSHLVFGAVAGAVVAHFHISPLWVSVPLAMAGALLPDIDHPKSALGSRVRPVSTLIAKVFGHRGLTHSLLAVLGLSWLLLHLSGHKATSNMLAPLLAGYLSHLIADGLTPMGVPLFWPVRFPVRFPLTVRTGSAAEKLLTLAVVVGSCWWLGPRY